MEVDKSNDFKAKGNVLIRIWSSILLPFAWFSPHSKLRVLFHRLRGVNIGKNVEIGYFCIIGNVHPKMIYIRDNAVITARVTLLEHDNSYYYTNNGVVKFGDIVVEKNAFIGIGSVVLPNITIGESSIIGANSVVIRDVLPRTINAGVPCRKLKSF
jgi:acetyltransferase-like isoleucine patch superfamily enzyme